MNNPEYILVDEFGLKDGNDQLTSGILFDVKQTLGLQTLNYQYGSVEELNQTLQSWQEASVAFANYKFPLVFILQPFTVRRGFQNYFGRVVDLRILIINKTDGQIKAKQRMTDNFKPILLPIYRELLRQIELSIPFTGTQGPGVDNILHNYTEMYYWAEQHERFLNDIVDTLVIDSLQLNINHNSNCTPFMG